MVGQAVLVDYSRTDYRGFLFVVHDIHGLMLLHCTRKKSKGPHFQVPGGHVDEPEFVEAGMFVCARVLESRNGTLQCLFSHAFALLAMPFSQDLLRTVVPARTGVQTGCCPGIVRRNGPGFALEPRSDHPRLPPRGTSARERTGTVGQRAQEPALLLCPGERPRLSLLGCHAHGERRKAPPSTSKNQCRVSAKPRCC